MYSLEYYGVDAAGNSGIMQTNNYTIGTTAPLVSASLDSGIYNNPQSVTLTASDNLDPNPVIYYSMDGGNTWNYQSNSVTIPFSQGMYSLEYFMLVIMQILLV